MIKRLNNIADRFQSEEIDGYIVDVQTANIILRVYNALNEENKKLFLKLGIERMANIAWQLAE